jgi:hypothetical protein
VTESGRPARRMSERSEWVSAVRGQHHNRGEGRNVCQALLGQGVPVLSALSPQTVTTQWQLALGARSPSGKARIPFDLGSFGAPYQPLPVSPGFVRETKLIFPTSQSDSTFRRQLVLCLKCIREKCAEIVRMMRVIAFTERLEFLKASRPRLATLNLAACQIVVVTTDSTSKIACRIL